MSRPPDGIRVAECTGSWRCDVERAQRRPAGTTGLGSAALLTRAFPLPAAASAAARQSWLFLLIGLRPISAPISSRTTVTIQGRPHRPRPPSRAWRTRPAGEGLLVGPTPRR
jgi:hypothetical protein